MQLETKDTTKTELNIPPNILAFEKYLAELQAKVEVEVTPAEELFGNLIDNIEEPEVNENPIREAANQRKMKKRLDEINERLRELRSFRNEEDDFDSELFKLETLEQKIEEQFDELETMLNRPIIIPNFSKNQDDFEQYSDKMISEQLEIEQKKIAEEKILSEVELKILELDVAEANIVRILQQEISLGEDAHLKDIEDAIAALGVEGTV